MPPFFRSKPKAGIKATEAQMGAPGLRDPKRAIAGTPPRVPTLAELVKLGKEPRLKVQDNQLLLAFGPGYAQGKAISRGQQETWHTLDDAVKLVEAAIPGASKQATARYESIIRQIQKLQSDAALMSELPLVDERLMTLAQARQRLADKVATQSFLRREGNPNFEGPTGRTKLPPVKEGDVQGLARRTKDRRALQDQLYKNKNYKALPDQTKTVVNMAVNTGQISVADVDLILANAKKQDPQALQDPERLGRLIETGIANKFRTTAVGAYRRDVSGSPNVESKLAQVVPAEVPAFIDEAKELLRTGQSGKGIAKQVKGLFDRIDTSSGVSVEQRTSIKNRVVEMLMRSNFGDDTLRELAKITAKNGGIMAQDAEGKLIPVKKTKLGLLGEGLASLKKLIGVADLTKLDLQAARENAALRGKAESKRSPGPADVNPKAPGTNPILALIRAREAATKPVGPPIPEVMRRGGMPYRPSTANPGDPLPVRSEVREPLPPAPPGPTPTPVPEMVSGRSTPATKDFALVQAIDDAVKGLKADPQRWREFMGSPTYKDIISQLRPGVSKKELKRILSLINKGIPPETYQEIRTQGPLASPTPKVPTGAVVAPTSEVDRKTMVDFVKKLQQNGFPADKIASIIKYIEG